MCKAPCALSVAMNPYCKNKEEAMKAVESVFESCYHDTMPFDKIHDVTRWGERI